MRSGRRASSAPSPSRRPRGGRGTSRRRGRVESRTKPRGENGFGYDPVFIVPGTRGKTSAELPAEEKNRMSHRAQAAAKAREILKELP